MKYLLIDTSSSNVTVSIIENKNILYNYQEKIISDMSSKIMPIMDDGLKNINLSLNDIDKIFVVNGPGSFTGVRVGVTIAKTIAWALKKDIIPISSLELMATTEVYDREYLVPMIDARRGNVFAGVYDRDLNCVKNDTLINMEELLNELDCNYAVLSYDKLPVDNNITPNPNVIKIIEKHENDKGVNPHNLNPNYLKLTEAEENRLKND